MSLEEPNAKKPRIDIDIDAVVSEAMINGIWSDDPSLHLELTIMFKKILSSNMTPSTENVIHSQVVGRLVQFLSKEYPPLLQHEAAWAIVNIASDKPDVVVDNGAVSSLVELLDSPNDDVLEMAIWALCFVAASSKQNRDYVLSSGVVFPLCRKLNQDTTKFILRMGTRTLLTFCRGLPPSLNTDKASLLLFDKVKGALPTLKRLLHSDDEQVLADACSALFYMSYGSQAGTQSVIEGGFIPRLVQLLQDTSSYIRYQVIGIIWILTSRDKQQIQCVIDGGALPIFASLLTQDNEKSIKDTCSIIKDITEGTKEQIQSVIDANLIPILVNLTQNAELDIKKEAVWAISKAAKGGCHDQIKYLVEQSCIKPLCDNLEYKDLSIIRSCLDGLTNILKVGEAEKNSGDHVNCYRQLIIDAEGKEKIENIKSQDLFHQDKGQFNYEIKEKAVNILEKYLA